MVKDIDKKIDKELIYGDGKRELVEIGNTEEANEAF